MNAERLQEIWYGDKPPGLLLRALERVYRSARERRERGLEPEPALVGKPIIVVGNITAGGTGKTPLVLRLTELLTGAGRSVAVISRGYGREGSGPVTVDKTTSAADCGDEPALIARRSGVPVYVDADREAAALRAFAAGAEIVLADDGLQRRQLPRQQELCVIDGQRGFGNGRLMPAGPLREPLDRLETVDYLIVNGTAEVAGLPERAVGMSLVPTALVRLADGERLALAEAQSRPEFQSVTALAGTGNPRRFFATLAGAGLGIGATHTFDDHHRFAASDFAAMSGTLVMTEKDAVKCSAFAGATAWYLEVDARLPQAWEAEWLKAATVLLEDMT